MASARPFFGGIPTDLDLKKLEDRFGVPDAGTLIPHAEIATCIGYRWKSSRYRTVLDRWRRKLMRESNIDTKVDRGVGLKILLPPERIVESEQDFKGNVRGIGRAAARIDATPTDSLTESERERLTRSKQVIWRTRQHAANEVKALRPPEPPKALPRPAPPTS